MDIIVNNQCLKGAVKVIESKSFAHRIMISAALAKAMTGKDTQIGLEGNSQDMEATRRVVEGLFRRDELLDCGESGTTLRFMLPVCAAMGLREKTYLTGHGRLMQRPMGPLIEAMTPYGVEIAYEGDCISCSGRLRPGQYKIAADVSSQYISGLLFALPLLDGDSTLELVGQIESRPYIDITLKVLEQFGIKVEEKAEGRFSIKGNQIYESPGFIQVEGDWSNGAFWLAAGAIGGGPVTVNGLNLNSVQGARRICEILKDFGAVITEGENSVTCQGGKLKGRTIDVKDIPDLVPILSVVAAAAEGETRICNGARLRIKESDRLMTVAAMLTNLGVQVEEGEDYLVIQGTGKAAGGVIDGANDHRIVMSGAIAAAICQGSVTIVGAEAVNKSYPDFFKEREKLCQVHGERI